MTIPQKILVRTSSWNSAYTLYACVCSVYSLWDVKSCQFTKHSWANLFTKPHKALILSPPFIVNFQCPFPFTAIQTQCVCGCVYRCLPRSWPGQWEHGRESTPHKGNVSGEVVNPDSPPTSLLQAKLYLETEREEEKQTDKHQLQTNGKRKTKT